MKSVSPYMYPPSAPSAAAKRRAFFDKAGNLTQFADCFNPGAGIQSTGLLLALTASLVSLGGCSAPPSHVPAFHWTGHARPHPERAIKSPEVKSTFLKGRVLCAPLDTSNAKPLHFSAGELKRYVASYNSVPVRGLRAAFDAYRAGKADTATAQSLRPYGTALFADRFRLFTITGNMGDGYVLRVQFRHHPEVVYLAALVFIKDKTPSIPVFESGPCSVAEQKWISTTYSQPLALGDDGSLTNPPTTHAPR